MHSKCDLKTISAFLGGSEAESFIQLDEEEATWYVHCTHNSILKLGEDLQVARAKTSVVDLQWVQLGRRDNILPRISSFALVVGGH